MNAPPRRVRVTSPRVSSARTRRVAPASEIDSRTRLGEIYLSSLLRAQLRLSLGVLAALAVPVVGLPLLFHLVPEVWAHSVLGVPLSWAVLGCAAYPFLFASGWYYVRRAERNERVFARLVDPSRAAEDAE